MEASAVAKTPAARPLPRTIVYTRTAKGPVMVPLLDQESKDEESAVEYQPGGYLPIAVDDRFAKERYIVVRKLGWGHFSTVWLVKDTLLKRHCALKVVKSAQRYAQSARDEIKILKRIHATTPGHLGHDYIVRLLDSFDHPARGDIHVCMVMEPLGETLYTLIEKNKKTGISSDLVKTTTRQILLGLAFLHDECGLVHTDIKPENILIAIPDVEEHIQTELLSARAPSCRHVGIPIQVSKNSRLVARRADRSREHVRIFDSQPLPSPSGTRSPLSRSPMEPIGLLMSKLTIKDQGSPHSTSCNTSNPASVNGVSTAPTSLSSDASKLMSQSQASISETLECDHLIARVLAPEPRHGPSLLSRTAPVIAESLSSSEFRSTQWEKEVSPVTLSSSVSIPEHNLSQTQSGVFLSPPHIPMADLHESPTMHIKIADLGNATPSQEHYTEEIQTRQYRAPEAILGRKDWNFKVDIWSLGCIVFELLTGDMLFDPQIRDDHYTKDDDHMAMIIELLGDDYPFDPEFKMGGKRSREMFNINGTLRHIHVLQMWSLRQVMVEKYLYQPGEAQAICDFILPMLAIHPSDRANASTLSKHEWLLEEG